MTTKTEKFISKAIEIAKDDSHGYSQLRRWGIDYDCSSLMYICAMHAGYPINERDPRYTGTMVADFAAVGFRCDFYDGNLNDLEPGDILLNIDYHTAVYIGDGLLVEASSDENHSIEGDMQGDQDGHEIHIAPVYNYPWTHVLTPPKEDVTEEQPRYKTIDANVSGITHEGAIARLALDAINGKFGNGSARKENMYNEIQEAVNILIRG